MDALSAKLASLRELVEQWARGSGLNVSLVACEMGAGLVLNATLLPEGAYREFFIAQAAALGLGEKMLDDTFTLDTGERIRVLGLDPVLCPPLIVVRSEAGLHHISIDELKSIVRSRAHEED